MTPRAPIHRSSPGRNALITGCSSGIGRAAAGKLLGAGFAVFATARRPETLGDLAAAGATTLGLDVTDQDSMSAGVAAVEAEHGSVDVLVNNAGYGAYGTIEEADLDAVRRQFETNVFGLSRMCQLVLPGMRAAGRGRIINISSMGGRLVFPVGGYYHASKYAVEAISDALRFEARPFGVYVSLVEPGLIRTGFGDTATGTLAGSAAPGGPYARLNEAAGRQISDGYRSRFLSAAPSTVADVIKRAATAGTPRARYVVTPAATALVHARRLLGSRAFDAFLRAQFRGSSSATAADRTGA